MTLEGEYNITKVYFPENASGTKTYGRTTLRFVGRTCYASLPQELLGLLGDA